MRRRTRRSGAARPERYARGLAATLDIRSLTCPLTWVRTKLALERLAPGEELEVLCPQGEALENVPRSAAEAGHEVTVEGAVVRIVRR